MKFVSVLGVLALAAGSLVVSAGVAVADVSPTTTADDGSPGSLREILENLSGPETVVLEPGATYDLTLGGDINIAAAAVIEGNGATIRQTDGASRVLDTAFDLTLRNVTITGGIHDGTGAGVRSNGGETLQLEGATITENVTYDDDGGGIYASGPVVMINTTVSNNSAEDDGGGLTSDAGATIINSTFSGNCAEDDSGAIDSGNDTTIVNSTITENLSDDDGAIGMDAGDLTLVYTDLVENTLFNDVECPGVAAFAAADPSAGDDEPDVVEPDEVETDDIDEASNLFMNTPGHLTTFGSVIALPLLGGEGHINPPFNCSGNTDETESLGYNFSDDDTCGLAADTDTEDGGDPLLGALDANGGPTLTRLPLTRSPLLDAIPLDSCGDGDSATGEAITTDQRGLPRPAPDGLGCEIGSVEVQPPVVPVPEPIFLNPTFTG